MINREPWFIAASFALGVFQLCLAYANYRRYKSYGKPATNIALISLKQYALIVSIGSFALGAFLLGVGIYNLVRP